MKICTMTAILMANIMWLSASAALVQIWRPQAGVAPSYRKPDPTVTVRVATQPALQAALTKASGGEVIGLAPGSYSINLVNRSFARPVTITSADPVRPAKISWIGLKDVSNLVFTRLELHRTLKPGEHAEATHIGKVGGGRDIIFDSVYVHGSLDDDASNDMNGLSIGGTRNAQVLNSEFEQLGRAIQFGAVSNVVVANNKVHGMRSDGFNFAQSSHVLIDGNHFSDSRPVKADHPDAIQFWTTRTTLPSTDIVIRNNQIIQGKGGGTQGIFMRDIEGLLFERVIIENNLMIGSNMANGIFVENGLDVSILNNTVISPTDDANPVWIRTKNVKNRKLEGNIADLGGNKTPDSAKINMSLLRKDRFRMLTAEDVIVPGIGFQLKQ